MSILLLAAFVLGAMEFLAPFVFNSLSETGSVFCSMLSFMSLCYLSLVSDKWRTVVTGLANAFIGFLVFVRLDSGEIVGKLLSALHAVVSLCIVVKWIMDRYGIVLFEHPQRTNEIEIPAKYAKKKDKVEISDEYLKMLKQAAINYMPSAMSAAQLEPVYEMINGLIDANAVKLMLEATSWSVARRAEADGDEDAETAVYRAFAETGWKINGFINCISETYYAKRIASATEETLLKAFIAADFYASLLKDECNTNLRKLQISIAREMLKRGFTVGETSSLSEFEQLQMRCNQAVKENPDAEDTKALVHELGKKLLSLEKIYVAYDEDFNKRFPFITTDGRIEVCTKLEIANALFDYYHERHLGHLCICEFSGDRILAAFNSYQQMGIDVLRLDNGSQPIDIWFKDILEPIPENLLERRNNVTKGEFLRSLQYSCRISKIDPSERDGNHEHCLMERMLTMRYNAYRNFGNGLCYVLATAPHKAGTTFYTEKALAKAKEMLAEDNLSESALIAEGDNAFAVYDSNVELRVAQKPGQAATEESLSESFVCVFTGHREAEQVRTEWLRDGGVDDSVLVITYDELYSHAMQCAGMLIDMPTYGLQLPKEAFQDIAKYRTLQGTILVALEENNG